MDIGLSGSSSLNRHPLCSTVSPLKSSVALCKVGEMRMLYSFPAEIVTRCDLTAKKSW